MNLETIPVERKFVRLLIDPRGVVTLTLNRPDRLNSLIGDMHGELSEALEELAARQDIAVLVLTGQGRAFCAGQDLSEPAMSGDDPTALAEVVRQRYVPLVQRLRSLPFPVVAAVNGVAAGAGASIALACDLVIAKESAFFLQPFLQLGMVPDTGGTYFTQRGLGPQRAMGWAMLGGKLPARQACDWGLIWECVADDDFDNAIERVCTRLAKGPKRAQAWLKHAMHQASINTLDQQLELECKALDELGASRDFREGVTAFKEKREPVFRDQIDNT